jgi:peptidoglycan/LPS O-acetylase OafA/YrhL
MMVMEYHLCSTMSGIEFLSKAYLGVDFFFLLSGFVLFHVYQTSLSLRSFFSARIARTYPLHLFMLLVLLPRFGSTPTFSGIPLLCNLTMTQAVCGVANSWNTASWSLSAEWFAYFLFPFILSPIRRCGGWFAVFAVVVCAAVLTIPGVEYSTASFGPSALCRSLPEFILGMLSYRVFQQGYFSHWSWLILACLAMGLTIQLGGSDLLVVAELCIILLASPNFWLLKCRPFVFLGQISYSLYMVHLLMAYAARTILLSWGIGGTMAFVALGSALSLGCATATYLGVEVPLRLKVRNWLDQSFRTAPAPRIAAGELINQRSA